MADATASAVGLHGEEEERANILRGDFKVDDEEPIPCGAADSQPSTAISGIWKGAMPNQERYGIKENLVVWGPSSSAIHYVHARNESPQFAENIIDV